MTLEQAIDWGMRLVMLAVTVLIFLWGRSQTQMDALVDEKALSLRRLLEHDREALQVLTEAKWTAFDTKARALDRLFESQFALRDQRIDAVAKQLADAAERASTAASKLTGKMGEVDHRLTVLETRMDAGA